MSDEEKGAVHVYVDATTHDAFVAYSLDLGWGKKTSLPQLLVTREFKLRRLCGASDGLQAAPSGNKKISVYLGDRRRALEEHAAPLTPTEALSRLIRLELDERWLLNVLTWTVA